MNTQHFCLTEGQQYSPVLERLRLTVMLLINLTVFYSFIKQGSMILLSGPARATTVLQGSQVKSNRFRIFFIIVLVSCLYAVLCCQNKQLMKRGDLETYSSAQQIGPIFLFKLLCKAYHITIRKWVYIFIYSG